MGQVTKLKIEAFEKMDCTGTSLGDISLQVNPEKISFEYSIEKNEGSGGSGGGGNITSSGGASAASPNPLMGNPSYKYPNLQVTTLIDATGVLPAMEGMELVEEGLPSVAPFITKLKKLTYNYYDSTHGPPWLAITWGKILPSNNHQQDQQDGVFRGQLSNLSIEYVLFGAEGNPVRAEISMTITSAIHPDALPKGESPDLTHFIDIKYGDNLPKLCKEIYGSPEFFLQIARINNLPSIYAIEPGMRLIFPPLDKASR